MNTYQQQFDKITEAYIKGEIKPMNANFCFCGTLHSGWENEDELSITPYTRKEYGKMEQALFSTFPEVVWEQVAKINDSKLGMKGIEGVSNYEEKLFAGMCAALEVLKQIHIERGEVIDQPPVFTKRPLTPSLVNQLK